MTLEQLIEQIKSLSKPGKGFKPHKFLALLAIIKLIRQKRITSRFILFDEAFRECFTQLLKEYGGDIDRDRPHNPFFHLSSQSFWHLVPNEGCDNELAAAKTVGSPGELLRLVSHAEIDESVFNLLKDSDSSKIIEQQIEKYIKQGMQIRNESTAHESSAMHSLFAHESRAINEIQSYIAAHKLGKILANLEIHDPQTNRYFETDIVIVSQFGVYVVELKHWSGLVEIRPNSWLQNKSFFKKDPHKANNFKAKLLKGLYEHRFPHLPSSYFESVVVFTNPEVSVEGASIPATTSNNPTFDSINRFFQYLKNQSNIKKSILTEAQCEAFAEYLQKLHTTERPRDFVFPGYEIVKRLYQGEDRAEVVARRTDIRHRRLSRLRIFIPPSAVSDTDRRVFHERATATLNAVSKVGEHPNILKVWLVPNENNYIVEGSDWSETGTLRDLLDEEKLLSEDRAIAITSGILSGLDAMHTECVVHRMLSPENVLMVDDTPKLMNFDLSYQLEDDRTTVIPDTTKLRRLPYIAPEIYKGGVTPEATADLFSVGVMLFEMVTGEKPFKCSTDLDYTDGKLGQTQRQKLEQSHISQVLQSVIIKLVSADPECRYSSASEVAAQLHFEPELKPLKVEFNARLNPGDQSGLYEIEEFLKTGAQAQIYRARGARAKQVALKLFNTDVPLQRVVAEHRFAGMVHHPSIVSIDSYSRWSDGRFYISFDWVSKKGLREDIDSGNRPDLERFQRIACQLLDTVEALHQYHEGEQASPILHNDIKPENILLAVGDRPVLIDFGSASHPRVGLYEGTTGYVAPDLHLGEDRQYCEDGDLFALGVTLFEWLCGFRPPTKGIDTKNASALGLSVSLINWFARAMAPDADNRFHNVREMKTALLDALKEKPVEIEEAPSIAKEEPGERLTQKAPQVEIEYVKSIPEQELHPNPFLSYLNSLHCCNAASENALAESQVRNPFFGLLHVPHPIAKKISEILVGEERRHVILTGHAGDGKSTIGVEVYKKLNGLSMAEPLDEDLEPRVNIASDDIPEISLIKDLSEWSQTERVAIVDEMTTRKDARFLLISNTGTLLDSFKLLEERDQGNPIVLESDLLEAIDSSRPFNWSYRDMNFTIINLSMIDNLSVAEKIFERMIVAEHWEKCESRDCNEHCPVLRNIQLIRQNQSTVIERLFLAYRRMYEYGTRLTLRQLSAHMAYMITSGLTYHNIVKIGQKAARPIMSEFMFFNRFFGDNGREKDSPAQQLLAIRAIQKQHFGARYSPIWERKLWLQSKGLAFRLNANGCDNEFEALRVYGIGLGSDEGLRDHQARQQVRRMLFFLNKFDASDRGTFLKTFLNSLMIVDFSRWQREPESMLSLKESTNLHRRILHVLQEHFTGIKLPEGVSNDRHLFITLSRRSQEVRQSAQVVLTCIPLDDLSLKLVSLDNDVGGVRRQLVLKWCREKHDKIALELGLPFLDYVMLRNQGEVGEDLQTSYVDRLERFKGQLLQRVRTERRDDIMLVRLRTNQTFRRQIFAVRGDRLEVTDG